MASGRLGNGRLTATTWTNGYDVPTGKIASFSIFMVNMSGATALVSIAVSNSTSSPANSEYVEYLTEIAPGGILERTGFVASDYEYVLLYASAADVQYRIQGYEETP
jgi:hypothetical protein